MIANDGLQPVVVRQYIDAFYEPDHFVEIRRCGERAADRPHRDSYEIVCRRAGEEVAGAPYFDEIASRNIRCERLDERETIGAAVIASRV